MCTVNQPSNDWDMIRDYILDDTPFVLAVQDYNPKRDGAILEKEGVRLIESVPFHGKVVSPLVLTRGTVAVDGITFIFGKVRFDVHSCHVR